MLTLLEQANNGGSQRDVQRDYEIPILSLNRPHLPRLSFAPITLLLVSIHAETVLYDGSDPS